jgi:hypothetical protein
MFLKVLYPGHSRLHKRASGFGLGLVGGQTCGGGPKCEASRLGTVHRISRSPPEVLGFCGNGHHFLNVVAPVVADHYVVEDFGRVRRLYSSGELAAPPGAFRASHTATVLLLQSFTCDGPPVLGKVPSVGVERRFTSNQELQLDAFNTE